MAVSFDPTGSGTATAKTETVAPAAMIEAGIGTAVTLTAYPGSDWVFSEWTVVGGGTLGFTGGGLGTNPAVFTMPAGDVSVKAGFSELFDVTLVPDPADGGTAKASAPEGGTPATTTRAIAGTEITLTAVAESGYVFQRWAVTADTPSVFADSGISYGNPATFMMPVGDVRIAAGFVPAEVSTCAGDGTHGFADGTGVAAQFNYPYGVAADGAGNVYVSEYGNNRIRKITSAGVVTTLAGSGAPGFADGLTDTAKFYNPHGVAVDGTGNVYVADYSNNRIRRIALE